MENNYERKKIYIKGDSERGDEVIKALTDLGGKNINGFAGNLSDTYYFINPNGYIAISTPTLLFYIKGFYKEVKLPKWKPRYKEHYYRINWMGAIVDDIWHDTQDEEICYEFGNCFETYVKAKAARDKIEEILKNS